jgi:hypothetical protein
MMKSRLILSILCPEVGWPSLRKVNDNDFDDHPVNSLSSCGMANRLRKVTDDDYGSKRNQVVTNSYSSKPFQLGDNDSLVLICPGVRQ